MKTVVCTLYEGHYHYGVAGLINSLYKHGFRGDFYVGYRGAIPFWATTSINNFSICWKGVKSLQVVPDLKIHFLPVVTDSHFTNYKPSFIREVWENCAKQDGKDAIFYFDPDIVNKCDWGFYERWVSYGVTLVHEVVRNDMPPNHPKRLQWMSIANGLGLTVKNKLNSYINAGFIGVHKDHIGFIKMWEQLMDYSSLNLNFDKKKFFQSRNGHDMFTVGDQDLLNLTAMCTEESISEFGPEGMDFIGGGRLMSHATGSPKPWKVNFMEAWLKGKKPSISAVEYWKNSNGIIKCYSDSFIKRKILFIKVASALSRFYNK